MPQTPLPLDFDLSAIEFPSDQVTVSQLRKRQPTLLNCLEHHPDNINQLEVIGTMAIEQEFALRAFAREAGLPDPYPNPLTGRSETISILDKDYRRYGISNGPAQTKQMIRAVEKAAAAQVRSTRGAIR